MSDRICSQGHVVEENRETCSRCNGAVVSPVAQEATVAPKVSKPRKTVEAPKPAPKPVKAEKKVAKPTKVVKKTKSKK